MEGRREAKRERVKIVAPLCSTQDASPDFFHVAIINSLTCFFDDAVSSGPSCIELTFQ